MNENELSRIAISSALKIHQSLGPGLLESAYKECMYYELKKNGLYVEKEKPVPLLYDQLHLGIGYRLDLLLESKLIIEVKSIETYSYLHFAQVLTYLKLSNLKLGLLMNFNRHILKDGGIKRVVNGL